MKRTELNIFEYTDFRNFLNDRLNELKDDNTTFSRRYFVKKLGLASSSYLSRIIDGSKNLSERLARKLPDVLGLTVEETSFFYDLVRYGQAKTTAAKVEALDMLRRNRRFIKVHQLALDHFDYYSDPLTLTLREMVANRDFSEEPQWIAKRLPFKSSPKKIKLAIEKLIRLGFLERDDQGKLVVCTKHVASGDHLGSVPLRTYHRNMLEMAAESIEKPVNIRHFRGLTVSIPSETYEEITEQMAMCVNRVRAIVDASGPSDHVYHLEMSLFPLTNRDEDDATK